MNLPDYDSSSSFYKISVNDRGLVYTNIFVTALEKPMRNPWKSEGRRKQTSAGNSPVIKEN